MFDLCAPMKGCVVSQGRYLFLEGDMKYKDNVTKVRLESAEEYYNKRDVNNLFCRKRREG